jgi:hypothetical protein
MQRRWKIAFAAAGIAVVAAGLAALLVLLVSSGRPVASQRAVPVRHPQRPVGQLGTGRRSKRRRRTITLAGAGIAVVAAGLAALLVPLVSGGRPVASQRAVPVRHLQHPVPIVRLPVMHDAVSVRLVSPFTGEPVKVLGRVIVAKIDNIVDARPPTNLTSADIVYVLPVEGGLSRIFAVYSARIPAVIGPVRSAREDDLELLAQFGRPGFAYSGAAPHLLPFIARAKVVNLSGTAAYFRDGARVAPHNLYAEGRVLAAEAAGASTARDIGFRFGPAPPGGRPATSVRVSYPAAGFTFIWSARARRWLVEMDGTQAADAAGGDLAAATVVIQDTVVRTSRFLEYGRRPPYAASAGSGTALVLRDGRAWPVRWSRPDPDRGTAYTLPSGARMTFAPGQVWVVLTTTNWATAGL